MPVLTNSNISSLLRQGALCRSGGRSTNMVLPVFVSNRYSLGLVDIDAFTISRITLSTVQTSGVTAPLTTLSPRPQFPSITATDGSPLTGLRVNITPADLAFTIFSTATPMGSYSKESPRRARAIMERGLNVLDHTLMMFLITSELPLIQR